MPRAGSRALPLRLTGTIPRMISVRFSVHAGEQLTALAGDAGRHELYNKVNDILDLMEDDPGSPWLRRRRYQHPPVWGVVTPSRDVERDWLILWSETEHGPLVHYIGEDLA